MSSKKPRLKPAWRLISRLTCTPPNCNEYKYMVHGMKCVSWSSEMSVQFKCSFMWTCEQILGIIYGFRFRNRQGFIMVLDNYEPGKLFQMFLVVKPYHSTDSRSPEWYTVLQFWCQQNKRNEKRKENNTDKVRKRKKRGKKAAEKQKTQSNPPVCFQWNLIKI